MLILNSDKASKHEYNHEYIKTVDNHIYFYANVNKKSCLNLNIEIKKLSDLILNSKKRKYDNIYLHLNSYGGTIYDSLSTVDTIKNCQIPIVSIIEGGVASATTLISVVCDHRIMLENSYILIHQLSTGFYGKFEELKDDYENCEDLMTKMVEIYVKHTKMKEKDVRDFLKRDKWWSPEKCHRFGIVDEIKRGEKKERLNSTLKIV